MITTTVFDGNDVTVYEDLADDRPSSGFTWVQATDSSEAEFRLIADSFDIHPLSIDDIRLNNCPKVEQFSTHTFALLKTATLTRGETDFREEIRSNRIGFFVGDDWLVVLSTDPVPSIDERRHHIVHEDQNPLERGPDFVAYRLIETIVDDYFEILDQIEDRIEAAEEMVLTSTEDTTLDSINDIRRKLLLLRKYSWSFRETVGLLARGHSNQIRPSTEKYYRDMYDHLVQIVELTETYRDLVNGARDIYLNTISQSTNDVMKTLTVVATIVLPLTLVAGIYGMNFRTMPELGWTFGYPAVLFGMLSIALLLILYFKRQRYV